MKKYIVVMLVAIIVASCGNNNSESFQINGKINKEYQGYVYLQKYGENGFEMVDSAKVRFGEFEFEGTVSVPEMYFLQLADKEDSFKFFIENAIIEMNIIADSIKTSTIHGSATQDLFEVFVNKNKDFNNKLSSIYEKIKAANDNKLLSDSLEQIYEATEDEQFAFYNTFVQENSSSVVAPYIIRRYMIYYLSLDELEKLTSGIDLSLAESGYTKWLFKRIELLRKVAIGKEFTDFTLNDIDNNPFSLSQLKGKVILVDFWASWCGPCRRENPNVVKIYNKYNNKGFDILGVSFDKDYNKWLDAINEDHLTWNHVSDLQGWANAAGKLYGVMSIPHTVLIDKNGIIAAENLRGEELENKIKELL